MLQALLTLKKYETTNYDMGGMRMYSRNIFQWNKNDIKSNRMETTYFNVTIRLVDLYLVFAFVRD